MKLMKRLMKKNNKGMSLVELICAVAILGLTTTALGGAMVMSAKHYYRDSAEFEVQQDAQTATNLIGNLVTDAADAEWNNNKLTITADSKTHVIYQEGDKLVYESGAEKGVLAEGLPANAFEADTSKFKDNKSVNISLKVQSGEKEFTSNYNATSRNGELSTTALAEKVCAISMEDEVVIEPKQSYGIKVDLNGGMTIPEVGGIQVDWTNALSDWKNTTAIKYDDTSKKVWLKAPDNADGNFQFEVKTGFKPNTTEYWDTQTVSVKVRRVDAVTINKVSGSGYTAGSVYVFAAAVVGDNLSKGYGRDYDQDYKNPKWIDFQISGVNYEILEDKSKTDTPRITIKLTSDMAAGDVFKVDAVSTHAAIGKVEAPGAATIYYNKTGEAYNPYAHADWSDTCTVAPIPTATIDPNYPVPVLPAGILRGEDYNFGATVPSCNTLKQSLENKYGTTVKFNWCIAFREAAAPGTPENAWNPYHFTFEEGDNEKVAGDWETTIMLPDKAYDIRFFIIYYDDATKAVLYPHDENMLNDKGIKDAGFTKGWADEDAAATEFDQYGNSTTVPAAELYYYRPENNYWYDGAPGVQYGYEYKSYGTKSSPIQYTKGNTPKIYYNMKHLSVKKASYTYELVLWKLKPGTTDTWELYTKASFQQTGGSPKFIQVNQVQEEGIYRLGVTIAGTAMKYSLDRADSSIEKIKVGDKDVPKYIESFSISTPMKLYDESGTDGFFYFEIQ